MYKLFFEKTDILSPKEQSAAAHSLLRCSLAKHFGIEESSIIIRKDINGAPFVEGLDGVFVSISHTKGMVACAFADSRVGVDVETVSLRRKMVEKRVFTPREIEAIDEAQDENLAFFTLWTLKESWLKAIGTGFAGNAKEIEFTFFENTVLSNLQTFSFFSQVRDGYAISLCVENQKIFF